MDQDFKNFLSEKGITEDKYNGGSLGAQAKLVKLFERSKQAVAPAPAPTVTRRVNFAVTHVPVVHWQGGTTKIVDVDLDAMDLFEQFVQSCRDAFVEEIGNSMIRIYALPHGYEYSKIGDRKHQIRDSEELRGVLHDRRQTGIYPRTLHVFVDEDNKSPSESPAERADAMETVSNVSRNTEASLQCRNMAHFTCAFCGARSPSRKDVQAAHIFEVQHFNALRTHALRFQALQVKGLKNIHDVDNLICLCTTCRGQFDAPYNIGINPATHLLEVKSFILNEYAGKGKFSKLVDKEVNFTVGCKPPPQLLEYRYRFFKEGAASVLNATGKKRRLQTCAWSATSTENKTRKTVVEPELPPAAPLGYTVLLCRASDTVKGGYSSGSMVPRNCVCAQAYDSGSAACHRCRRWFDQAGVRGVCGWRCASAARTRRVSIVGKPYCT